MSIAECIEVDVLHDLVGVLFKVTGSYIQTKLKFYYKSTFNMHNSK